MPKRRTPAPDDRRLVLERSSQPPVITRSGKDYIIWIHFALNFEAGTYLRLTPTGAVYRELMEPTGEIRFSIPVAEL